MPFLAAGAVFATVFLLLLALQGGGATAALARARLAGIGGRPAPSSEEEDQLTLKQRTLAPFAEAMVQNIRRVMPTKMLEGIERKLVMAGDPMTVNSFLIFQALVTGAFVLLPVLVVVGGGMSYSLVTVLFLAGFALVGLYIPRMWLNQRSGQRQAQIIKSLPDSFDLITTCVEAGLGLDAALTRVSERVEGPFADELRRSLREISLGKARRDALRELGERTQVPDLMAFVNAVNQAEQMGSSIGTVLRVQADQLRVRRRQRAEQQAYKAPVKMIFPLILCIFPTLFIVILGPAIITIMTEFPGG